MLQVSSIYKGRKSAEKYTLCMFLEVKRIKRISGLRHLYYCTRSEVKLHIARKNGMPNKTLFCCIFWQINRTANYQELRKKKNLLHPGYCPRESTSWMSPARQSIAANPHIHSYILCNSQVFSFISRACFSRARL